MLYSDDNTQKLMPTPKRPQRPAATSDASRRGPLRHRMGDSDDDGVDDDDDLDSCSSSLGSFVAAVDECAESTRSASRTPPLRSPARSRSPSPAIGTQAGFLKGGEVAVVPLPVVPDAMLGAQLGEQLGLEIDVDVVDDGSLSDSDGESDNGVFGLAGSSDNLTDQLVGTFATIHRRLRDAAMLGAAFEMQRLLVFAPRLLTFSHRGICSVRHPRLSYRVWARKIAWNAGAADASRAHLLDTRDHALLSAEAARWRTAGAAIEAVNRNVPAVGEALQRVRESASMQHSLARIWQRIVGAPPPAAVGTDDGAETMGHMTRGQYVHFELRLYNIYFSRAAAMDAVDAIAADFALDSEPVALLAKARDAGGAAPLGVTFDGFCEGMVELADNWTATTRVAEYAAFLADLLVQAFPPDFAADTDTLFQVILQRREAVGAGQRDFARWQRDRSEKEAKHKRKYLTGDAARRQLQQRSQRSQAHDERMSKVRAPTLSGARQGQYGGRQPFVPGDEDSADCGSENSGSSGERRAAKRRPRPPWARGTASHSSASDQGSVSPGASVSPSESVSEGGTRAPRKQRSGRRHVATVGEPLLYDERTASDDEDIFVQLPVKLLAFSAKTTDADRARDVVARYAKEENAEGPRGRAQRRPTRAGAEGELPTLQLRRKSINQPTPPLLPHGVTRLEVPSGGSRRGSVSARRLSGTFAAQAAEQNEPKPPMRLGS
jgi:hypothetical protein